MNYTEIVETALSYADRQDDEVVSRMDLFLKMVESRINRKLSTLKMEMRSRTPMVVDQEYYALPIDFLSIRAIRIVSTSSSTVRKTLSYVNPEQFGNLVSNSATGDYYTIISSNLHIRTTYDSTYNIEIEYEKKIQALTSTTNTNWLSDNNPDCYIFGLLVEINAFIKDAIAKDLWDIRFKECLDEINLQDNIATWSGTALQIRVG